jgi:hypothetical protein
MMGNKLIFFGGRGRDRASIKVTHTGGNKGRREEKKEQKGDRRLIDRWEAQRESKAVLPARRRRKGRSVNRESGTMDHQAENKEPTHQIGEAFDLL